MIDAGVLLSLPTESIAIRAVIASLAAALLARLLLRSGLRAPRVRVSAAVVPVLSLIVIAVLCWESLRLPSVMLTVDAVDALPVRFRDTYLHFAPMAAPLLLGFWAFVAAILVGLRLRRARVAHRLSVQRRAQAVHERPGDSRVMAIVAQMARKMRVEVPDVALVRNCHGGATVVGVRKMSLLIDRDLASRLDDRELQGVIAHEFAHIRRHDNFVALALGIIRDLAFFVPGGRWALRQLHAERELAADQLAVRVTGRPAALASGLLKVVGGGEPTAAACAALVPRGSVVGRVQRLIDDTAGPGRARTGIEMAAVCLALTAAVAAAMQLPTAVAAAGQRDALAVLFRTGTAAPMADAVAAEERVFDVFRSSKESAVVAAAAPVRTTVLIDDDPEEMHRSTLRACVAGATSSCEQTTRTGLGLRPRVQVRTDQALLGRWQRATPLVSFNETIALHWLVTDSAGTSTTGAEVAAQG